MPEFAEVVTITKELSIIKNGKILNFNTPINGNHRDKDTGRVLKNTIIIEVFNRGKYIVFKLDNGFYFVIHLGMTGRLSYGQEVDRHEKFSLLIKVGGSTVNLRFSDTRGFGRFYISQTLPKESFIDPREVGYYSNLRNKLVGKERSVFLLLLDQSIAFGVGSYLAQETLFRAGIRPDRTFLTFEEAKVISNKLRIVINLAITKGGATMRDYRTLSGMKGKMQAYFKVYGLAGTPCVKCSTTLKRLVLQGRGVTFCPTCQI